MVGSGKNQQILIVPEGRLDRELLCNSGNVLESKIGNHNRVGANDGDLVKAINQAVDLSRL